MKNLVILISCLISSFLLSQEAIRIQYVLNYQPDSTDIKSKSQELMYLDILSTEKKSFFKLKIYMQKIPFWLPIPMHFLDLVNQRSHIEFIKII